MENPETLKSLVNKGNVLTSEDDNISIALDDLVPEKYKGTDQFLDIVQWNIEWFGARKSQEKDKIRFDTIVKTLKSLNADIFVFQEIAGPSKDGRYPGALDAVAEELSQQVAGDYVVYYTEAGGEQRVAMMWDRNWVRAKSDVIDLFEKGTHETDDGRDAFAQRTPLYGYFTTRVMSDRNIDKFDFQLLGVHLKAMEDGHDQRLKSAHVLANWMTKEAVKVDSDILIMGDWNAPPDDDCWKPFHSLEKTRNSEVFFERINDPSDFSYLWLKNKTDKYVSRIDLAAMTLSSMQQVVGDAATVVRWKPIEEVLAKTGNLTNTEVRDVLDIIKENISDHLPTLSRFYFSKP